MIQINDKNFKMSKDELMKPNSRINICINFIIIAHIVIKQLFLHIRLPK